MSIKLLGIGAVGVICLIASLVVYGLVSERESRFQDAQAEITSSWGNEQLLAGPFMVSGSKYVLPERIEYKITMDPQVRSRGIFDAVVYTARVRIEGVFSSEDLRRVMPVPNPQLPFMLALGMTDIRGIESNSITWNGSKLSAEPGSALSFMDGGIRAYAGTGTFAPNTTYTFAYDLVLKGSEKIEVLPIGKDTVVRIDSPWRAPKFSGAFLPSEPTIGDRGFDAQWHISHLGRPYTQIVDRQQHITALRDSAFGVELFQQVDFYSKIVRSIKYAVLFIAITFMAFFLIEILSGVRIHTVQYLLVGFALALFYLLLLSLSEHIGFLAAYIIATLMIAGLITIYSTKLLQSGRKSGMIFAILILLYGYLYFVLHLEDYALIFGSLLLFALLATIMYLTRNIDWYKLSTPKPSV
ncbi:MAG: hypothetical protein A3A33_03675 [Candidatus Yanofskybacteria bacterium RIFCSPLOWO2_01_FULL_49_25]|uniref:Cell envelope integrity protein CreD n=1 Tax=Candidatus Yanofskybacteria bacterium RIFCSPLOWO2_01_FULL_49_25 TaxID=1802701 RepID=A0A1F8GVI7_9BACT|nr:MAG: hypothetical protein A3A33_03675 [Candidatus Yanofskybacteria bacterium RIFCSPLOWO2_01_FULL_49_25]